MSSPVRRAALAGKNVNVKQTILSGSIRKGKNSSCHSSPTKMSPADLNFAFRHSPIKNVALTSPAKTPHKDTAPFTFHEETPSEKAAVLIEHVTLTQRSYVSNDENDVSQVKENMSPSKLAAKTSRINGKRKPLRDLSIEEHKGYIEDPRTQEVTPLTLHYKNKTKLPNFVTPPRNAKLQQYFTYNDTKEKETLSSSTDDIPKDKIVKKLNFKISGN